MRLPLAGHPYIAQWRAHGLCSATRADHRPITVPTSAYPRAFPAALASWRIPPPCRIRWTPAHRRGFIHPGFIRQARGVMDDQSCIALPAPMSTTRGDSVPYLRWPLNVGPHASPGFLGVSRSRLQTRSARICAIVAVADHPRRRLPPHDDSPMGSCACPCSALLDGIPGRIPSDRH